MITEIITQGEPDLIRYDSSKEERALLEELDPPAQLEQVSCPVASGLESLCTMEQNKSLSASQPGHSTCSPAIH